jgi:hypothetical protein
MTEIHTSKTRILGNQERDLPPVEGSHYVTCAVVCWAVAAVLSLVWQGGGW